MTPDQDIQVRIGIDGAGQYFAELKKVEKETEKATKKMSDGFGDAARQVPILGDAIGFLTNPIGAAIAALTGLGVVAKSSLSLAAEFEQTTVAFETMTGSAQVAAKLLGEITQFAAKTPFQQNEIENAAKQLLAFGFSTDEVIGQLKSLGDVSAGTGKPLGELAFIFGQVRSQGRAMTQDLNQFASAGIPIFDELGKILGVSAGEVRKFAEKGKISFDLVQTAFANLSGEGGRFFDLMDKQSQTTLGKFSTFKDSVEILGREFGQKLLPAANAVLDVFIKVVAEIDAFTGELQIIFQPITDVVSLLGEWAVELGILDTAQLNFREILRQVADNLFQTFKFISLVVDAYKSLSNAIFDTNFQTSKDVELQQERNANINKYLETVGATKDTVDAFTKSSYAAAAAQAFQSGNMLELDRLFKEFIKTSGTGDPNKELPITSQIKELNKQITKIPNAGEIPGLGGGAGSFIGGDLGLIAPADFGEQLLGVVNTPVTPAPGSLFDLISGIANEEGIKPIEDNLSRLAAAFGTVAPVVTQAFENIKAASIDALGQLAFDLGKAIAVGGSFADAFGAALKSIADAVLVQAPRMIGMALINAAVVLPPPASFALLAAGIGLIGFSGLASGFLSKLGKGGGGAGAVAGGGAFGGGGGNVAPRGASGADGLSTFNAGDFQPNFNLQVMIGNKEVSNIVIADLKKQQQLQGG